MRLTAKNGFPYFNWDFLNSLTFNFNENLIMNVLLWIMKVTFLVYFLFFRQIQGQIQGLITSFDSIFDTILGYLKSEKRGTGIQVFHRIHTI